MNTLVQAPAEIEVEHSDKLVTVHIHAASGIVSYQRVERRSKPRELRHGVDVVAMIRHVAGLLSACSFKLLLIDMGFQTVASPVHEQRDSAVAEVSSYARSGFTVRS